MLISLVLMLHGTDDHFDYLFMAFKHEITSDFKRFVDIVAVYYQNYS